MFTISMGVDLNDVGIMSLLGGRKGEMSPISGFFIGARIALFIPFQT